MNDQFASHYGFEKLEIEGSQFVHTVYLTKGQSGKDWHVYIEGDGMPWIQNRYISADPSTAKPLMLRLMVLDSNPVIYLGRPCYNLKHADPACHPWHWTHGRYSEKVISSMKAALEKLIQQKKIKKITLIGHSGGGTLAMFVAPEINQVTQVVTLAGNLNVNAWSGKHGYSKLLGSLSPNEYSNLFISLPQIHLIGKKDRIIPLESTTHFVNHQSLAELRVYEDLDHSCCWDRKWKEILGGL